MALILLVKWVNKLIYDRCFNPGPGLSVHQPEHMESQDSLRRYMDFRYQGLLNTRNEEVYRATPHKSAGVTAPL